MKKLSLLSLCFISLMLCQNKPLSIITKITKIKNYNVAKINPIHT